MSSTADEESIDRVAAGRRVGPTIRAWTTHLIRIAVVLSIALLIRWQQQSRDAKAAQDESFAISLVEAQRFFPDATQVLPLDPIRRVRTVLNAASEPVGFLLQTNPIAADIPGYSGPTNTMIAFNADECIVGFAIISSRDTPEYVARVIDNPAYLKQFVGRSWQQTQSLTAIDSISGATLTSLAIGEGIVRRLGGSPPELRFPEPVALAEVRRWFETASRLTESDSIADGLDVLDADDRRLGTVFRTTPAADALLGWEGPTDTLVALDDKQKVIGIALHASFDTMEYVDTIRDDSYFLNLFNGKSVQDLAKLDLFEEQVEGVSGATMTSQVMAEGIILRAAHISHPKAEAVEPPRQAAWGASDLGMAVVVLLGLVMTSTHLRAKRWLRTVWQVSVIGYFLLINRDLLSQAQLAGWAANGVPWRLAPGLALLAAASFAVPIVSRRQMYCHHVCPFGAAQQLAHRLSPWHWSLPRRIHRLLGTLPFLLLTVVVAVAMGFGDVNLAAIEPFDAFNWKLASLGSIVIAVLGLAVSLFIPMAYCQYGCPTGAVLGYVRMQSRARIDLRDIGAIACLLLAVVIMQWG